MWIITGESRRRRSLMVVPNSIYSRWRERKSGSPEDIIYRKRKAIQVLKEASGARASQVRLTTICHVNADDYRFDPNNQLTRSPYPHGGSDGADEWRPRNVRWRPTNRGIWINYYLGRSPYFVFFARFNFSLQNMGYKYILLNNKLFMANSSLSRMGRCDAMDGVRPIMRRLGGGATQINFNWKGLDLNICILFLISAKTRH